MVRIFAADGDVAVRIDEAEDPVTIRRGSVLHWHTNSDTLPDVSAAQTTIIPDWVTESPDPQTDATKILLSKLASGLQKNESITSAALSLSEDRNPQIAAYAMKLPVMLRRVDELAIMLMQSESQVVRRESMKGLEQILYQVPQGAARIREVLETRLWIITGGIRFLRSLTTDRKLAINCGDGKQYMIGSGAAFQFEHPLQACVDRCDAFLSSSVKETSNASLSINQNESVAVENQCVRLWRRIGDREFEARLAQLPYFVAGARQEMPML